MSTLRAVSPLHLQYLRNMGVRASVVLSLIHQGKLWGMLVCHHSTPRLPPRHMTHALCVASELISGTPEAQWPARRSHLAEQDLTYLGYPAPPTDRPLACLPDATGVRWYGLAYVMQGSALGGQVIAAHLQRLLGLQAGLGASFFAVHVPATAERMAGGRSHRPRQDWTTWTQWLDQQLDSQQPSTEEAVSAAIATYDYLYDAFSCEPDPTTGV